MGNKIKTVKSGGSTYFVFQSEKNQSLSERELYIINSGAVIGLLPITAEQKGKTFRLVYNVTGLVTVRDYIRNTLNKTGFSVLLSNIVESLESMEKSFLKLQFAILDIDYVMVNPATQKVYFPFVPIQFYENDTTLKDFLLNIANNCNFQKSEDTSYVGEYVKILNKGINFSFFDLAEYTKRLADGTLGPKNKLCKCTNCKANFAFGMNFCPVCGTKIGGISDLPENAVYDPAAANEQSVPQSKYCQQTSVQQTSVQQTSVQQTSVQQNSSAYQNNGGFNNGFNGDFYQNAGLQQGGQQQAPPQYPGKNDMFVNRAGGMSETIPMGYMKMAPAMLMLGRTGERIRVDKSPFVLGKDPMNTNYCIRNNTAVSRRHAQILFENGTWFFMDMGSTNKSFINGQIVAPQQKIPLGNGVAISLANESFVFYLN